MFAKINLITLAGALACATIAHAGPVDAPRADVVRVTKTVSVEGLDLKTSRGAEIALDRIKAAASSICGSKPDTRLLAENIAYRACLKDTTDRAVAEVASPLITALHTLPRPARLAAAQD